MLQFCLTMTIFLVYILSAYGTISFVFPVIEQNLTTPDLVAHGVGRTTDFLGDLGRRPAIAESYLDDDSFFECEMWPFAMRRFYGTL